MTHRNSQPHANESPPGRGPPPHVPGEDGASVSPGESHTPGLSAGRLHVGSALPLVQPPLAPHFDGESESAVGDPHVGAPATGVGCPQPEAAAGAALAGTLQPPPGPEGALSSAGAPHPLPALAPVKEFPVTAAHPLLGEVRDVEVPPSSAVALCGPAPGFPHPLSGTVPAPEALAVLAHAPAGGAVPGAPGAVAFPVGIPQPLGFGAAAGASPFAWPHGGREPDGAPQGFDGAAGGACTRAPACD
jgi:hypothetical protein